MNLKWNLNKANFQELSKMLDKVDWSVLSRLDVDTGYQLFRDTLFSLMDEHVPKAKRSYIKKNMYMNREALRLKKTETHTLVSIQEF